MGTADDAGQEGPRSRVQCVECVCAHDGCLRTRPVFAHTVGVCACVHSAQDLYEHCEQQTTHNSMFFDWFYASTLCYKFNIIKWFLKFVNHLYNSRNM